MKTHHQSSSQCTSNPFSLSLSLSLSLSKLEKSMGRSILGLPRIAQEFHKNRGKKYKNNE
jgi:hypothetical protein